MTLATWKAEFYPTEAKACPEQEAAAHSLRKWTGLLPENLARHGCVRTANPDGGHDIVTDLDNATGLMIDGGSCALCHWHYSYGPPRCGTCPLALVREGASCEMRGGVEGRSPWSAWSSDGDPRPMVHWLSKIPQPVEGQQP